MELLDKYVHVLSSLPVAIVEKDIKCPGYTVKCGTLLYLCKDKDNNHWYVNENNAFVATVCSGYDLRHIRLLQPIAVERAYLEFTQGGQFMYKPWRKLYADRVYK